MVLPLFSKTVLEWIVVLEYLRKMWGKILVGESNLYCSFSTLRVMPTHWAFIQSIDVFSSFSAISWLRRNAFVGFGGAR